jgi:hypothetical protein
MSNEIIEQLAKQLHGDTSGIENLDVNEPSNLVFFTYQSQIWAAKLTKDNKKVRKNTVRMQSW